MCGLVRRVCYCNLGRFLVDVGGRGLGGGIGLPLPTDHDLDGEDCGHPCACGRD